MKTTTVSSFVLAAAFLSMGALAQAQTPASTVTNTPPAPTATVSAALPAPNQVIYSPRLPTAIDLSNAASAQGLTVTRIEQSSNQVTAVYQLPNGQTNVVAYQLLPTSGSAAVATTTPAPTVVMPQPTATVVQPAPSAVYYQSDYGYPYYPGYWYPPVSVRLGFGYGYGYRGYGGYHGGFRGGFHR